MRNLQNAINAYKNQFQHQRTGTFYSSDYYQLAAMSKNQRGEIDPYFLVDNTMMAAFMIGYRCAKRQQQKRKGNPRLVKAPNQN